LVNNTKIISRYRGRFAPSPTGDLHYGSLFAALVSWLDARHENGSWILRIDDLDKFRCNSKTNTIIIDELAKHGFLSDEKPVKQSERLDKYLNALKILEPFYYECRCSRKKLKAFPCCGTCLSIETKPDNNTSLRINTSGICNEIIDKFHGKLEIKKISDFTIRRGDQLISYQLACSVDETIDSISHIIRGWDLLESTIMQNFLREKLEFTKLTYGHFPILVDKYGKKLSKQGKSASIHKNSVKENFQFLASLLGKSDIPSYKNYKDWLKWFFDFGKPSSWLKKKQIIING